MAPVSTIQMDVDALYAFLAREFPQALKMGFEIVDVDATGLCLRLPFSPAQLRPGKTISGPTMMALADSAMYLLLLSRLGPVRLAVTTNLNIHFMRRPDPSPLVAHARLLKLGSRLAVGTVLMRSEDRDDAVAHATLTYSLPPPP